MRLIRAMDSRRSCTSSNRPFAAMVMSAISRALAAPSLLAMPYLGDVDVNDPVYQNTRRLVLSPSNPYFFKGKAGEGIGGPHIGFNYIWPMSLIMRATTSNDEKEIRYCIETLRDTDGGTGFMHESFLKVNPSEYSRSWFAWTNTLFGELIVKLQSEGKLKDLLG